MNNELTSEIASGTGITFYTYLIYLAISIALTIWVARTLHKNGRVFLVDVFHGNEALADSVNHLLVVGFYLINFGYVSLALKLGYDVATAQASIEALSVKVGMVLLVLGGMHFFNLFIFSRMRRRTTHVNAPPPVVPDEFTAVAQEGWPCTRSPFSTIQRAACVVERTNGWRNNPSSST